MTMILKSKKYISIIYILQLQLGKKTARFLFLKEKLMKKEETRKETKWNKEKEKDDIKMTYIEG